MASAPEDNAAVQEQHLAAICRQQVLSEFLRVVRRCHPLFHGGDDAGENYVGDTCPKLLRYFSCRSGPWRSDVRALEKLGRASFHKPSPVNRHHGTSGLPSRTIRSLCAAVTRA
jgi:hypothetical protein